MAPDAESLFDPQRPTHLLLMRHPQTEGNVEHRFYGQHDSPLSEFGQKQLQRAVAGLVAWQPDLMVSSPIARCLAIAEPVAEQSGCPLVTDDRLKEMGFGALEGLDQGEAVAQGLGMPWNPNTEPGSVAGAESLQEFSERVVQAADWLTQQQGNVAVISHGGVIRTIVLYWLHLQTQFIWQMAVRNIESACFSVDKNGSVYLEAFGLWPEWLAAPPANSPATQQSPPPATPTAAPAG